MHIILSALSVLGVIAGFVLGFKISPLFVSKREKYGKSEVDLFIQRIGNSIFFGTVGYFLSSVGLAYVCSILGISAPIFEIKDNTSIKARYNTSIKVPEAVASSRG